MVFLKRTTKYFLLCIALALCLCGAQILGNNVALLLCLAAFLVLVGLACTGNFTLPILLFFLPWSQLLRTNPTTFSFFTFGLVMVCALSVLKNWNRFRRYHLLTALGLLFLTLISKLLDGSGLSFDYLAFMMLLMLFPVVRAEWNMKRYNFYLVTAFFASGVILAALCAQIFASAPNISAYINVHSYLTIRRMSGFYGDPNFYTAQILVVLGSCLILVLKEEQRAKILSLIALSLLLIYCGLLSGSKSFAIVAVVLFLLWVIQVFRLEGRVGFKAALLIGSGFVIILLSVSSVLSSMLDVIATRFNSSSNISGFTTGRTDLWLEYCRELWSNGKLLLLGKGFTKSVLSEKSTHNTLLQAVYQFGILGAPLLVVWVVGFFRSGRTSPKSGRKELISKLILLTGAFLPWFAIDALFFDEFFLLQWFVLIGLRQLNTIGKEAELHGRTNAP